jgi:hypothetical protein
MELKDKHKNVSSEPKLELKPEYDKGPWTEFWDMHSGGGQKEKWAKIFIQAPEEEARVIFYNRFGHNPDRVTCTCCGPDYAVREEPSLTEATRYQREEAFGLKTKLDLVEYLEEDGVLAIFEDDIKPQEREGDVPRQGYVWVD